MLGLQRGSSLWCVLDLSPTGRSLLEVRTALRYILVVRHSTSPTVLCTLIPARFRSVSVTFTWRVLDFIRVFERFSSMAHITLTRFHLRRLVSFKNECWQACPAFANRLRQITKVSTTHVRPLVCKIYVFSDVDMFVEEGGPAIFFHVASAQSVSPFSSKELS